MLALCVNEAEEVGWSMKEVGWSVEVGGAAQEGELTEGMACCCSGSCWVALP